MHSKYLGIIARDANGNKTRYPNVAAAARVTGAKKANIYACLWGVAQTAKGYTFSPARVAGSPVGTRVIAKCKDGRAGKYNSVAEASLATGISATAIFNCLRGIVKNTYGVKWEMAK